MAEDDVLYFSAYDLAEAKCKFKEQIGDVPDNFLRWKEVQQLPEDAELAG